MEISIDINTDEVLDKIGLLEVYDWLFDQIGDHNPYKPGTRSYLAFEGVMENIRMFEKIQNLNFLKKQELQEFLEKL